MLRYFLLVNVYALLLFALYLLLLRNSNGPPGAVFTCCAP